MNWDAVGAVAEILGALGVIVTVAYLAIQIRQNSKLLASSLADSIRNGLNEATRIESCFRAIGGTATMGSAAGAAFFAVVASRGTTTTLSIPSMR